MLTMLSILFLSLSSKKLSGFFVCFSLSSKSVSGSEFGSVSESISDSVFESGSESSFPSILISCKDGFVVCEKDLGSKVVEPIYNRT